MNEKEILEKIHQRVSELLKNEFTGHDFHHIQRVVNNTRRIAKDEKCDLTYALLIAYLHDVGDYKIHDGEDKTEVIAGGILRELNFPESMITTIIADIQLVGYKGGFNSKPEKIEVQIVQDADRLDAIGAIGIARAFAYGGKKGRLLHDPDYQPENFESAEAYQQSNPPTVQHFYDKLFNLKDLMHTETGKKIAEERHIFMEKYLEQFYSEWG